MTDYDSPWKEILDAYFEAFLAFFFAQAHAEIDWSRGYESLDKEFQQIMREAELGRRWADKLVKVWRRSGAEVWVLIHVEIQSDAEADFAERMYVYNYRIFDTYRREVASFAVLGDDRPNWRPDRFQRSLWGCRVEFQFPIVKLLDYAADWPALEASANPFATVVMAHLKAKETSGQPQSRTSEKLRVVRGLYEHGFTAQNVKDLFRFIDWIMDLPKDLDMAFREEVRKIEEEKRMPFITSVERLAMEEGRRETLLEVIRDDLAEKFGNSALTLMPDIEQQDLETLRAIFKSIKTASTPEELRKTWARSK
jgi:hypothetical protein